MTKPYLKLTSVKKENTYCLTHLWSPASAESSDCVIRESSPSLGPASPSQLYPRGQFSRCGMFGPTPTAPALPPLAGGKHPFLSCFCRSLGWVSLAWTLRPGCFLSGLLFIFWTNICDSDWGALGHRLIPDLEGVVGPNALSVQKGEFTPAKRKLDCCYQKEKGSTLGRQKTTDGHGSSKIPQICTLSPL